jgi:hypothetical protein
VWFGLPSWKSRDGRICAPDPLKWVANRSARREVSFEEEQFQSLFRPPEMTCRNVRCLSNSDTAYHCIALLIILLGRRIIKSSSHAGNVAIISST